MTREERVKFLEEYLCSVYCDTCKHIDDDYTCDYCHRKDMNWGLSHKVAEEIIERLNYNE